MIDIVPPNNAIADQKTPSHKMHHQHQHHHPNKGLKLFFQQLAKDNGVKGFSLVIDNASTPRCDVKRISAPPPAMNGATRKFLSHQEKDDAAPSYPTRHRSSGVEAFHERANGGGDGGGSYMRWSASPSLESSSSSASPSSDVRFSAGRMNENSDSLLETVFDAVDSILYEGEEDDQDETSVTWQVSAKGENGSQQPQNDELLPNDDTWFMDDSNLRRFSVDRSVEESPRSICRPSALARQRKMERPKLPVRQESLDDFGTAMNKSDSASVVSSDTSTTSGYDAPISIPPLPTSSYAVCVPIEETNSWHEEEGKEYEDDNGYHGDSFTQQASSNSKGCVVEEEEQEDATSVNATTFQQLGMMMEDMVSPPPLEEPPPFNENDHHEDDDSNYSSRRLRRTTNRRRRSSLDTGHTFRNSFAQSSSSSSEQDHNGGEHKSRWDYNE